MKSQKVPGRATRDLFLPFVMPEKQTALTKVEKYTSYTKKSLTKVEEYKHEIARYKRYLEQEKATAKSYAKEARDAQKIASSMKVNRVKLAKEWERLHTHPMLTNVAIIKAGTLVLTTVPLFTDIRASESDKTESRAFLGVFTITVSLQSDVILIQNLTFKGNNAQWGVSSSSTTPYLCQGTWEPQLKDARERGQWSLFVTTVIQSLLSTEDGGAFQRSHTWRDRRVIQDVLSSERYSDIYRHIKIKYEREDWREFIGKREYNSGYRYIELDGTAHPAHVLSNYDSAGVLEVVDAWIKDGCTSIEVLHLLETYDPDKVTKDLLKVVDGMTVETAREHYALLKKPITKDVIEKIKTYESIPQ